MSRISSVTLSEIICERLCSASWESVELLADAGVAELRDGHVACAARDLVDRVITGAIWSAAVSGSPLMSNWTSAECPSSETWPSLP